jgi:hypothetical protein
MLCSGSPSETLLMCYAGLTSAPLTSRDNGVCTNRWPGRILSLESRQVSYLPKQNVAVQLQYILFSHRFVASDIFSIIMG